jgi:hypothetical protein
MAACESPGAPSTLRHGAYSLRVQRWPLKGKVTAYAEVLQGRRPVALREPALTDLVSMELASTSSSQRLLRVLHVRHLLLLHAAASPPTSLPACRVLRLGVVAAGGEGDTLFGQTRRCRAPMSSPNSSGTTSSTHLVLFHGLHCSVGSSLRTSARTHVTGCRPLARRAEGQRPQQHQATAAMPLFRSGRFVSHPAPRLLP